MMFIRGIITTTIFLLMLTSCLPTATKSTKLQDASTDSETDSSPTFSEDDTIYWYSGSNIPGTITINYNTQTVLYLRGSYVHDFLSTSTNFYNTDNSTKQYCLVMNFSATDKKQLRIRALPITYNNFQTGTVEKLFRIDFPYQENNSASCQDASDIDGLIETVNDSSDVAFIASAVCTSCSSINSASSISLYAVQNGGINDNNDDTTSIVSSESLDLSSLGLRLNFQGNTTEPSSSCSDTSCVAQGYDCCLDGQCVNDGALKPNASSNSDYQQALSHVAQNPLNFIYWPNIYYVCNNIVHPTPTATATPDVEATASAVLAQEIRDYNCLQGAKEDTPDYSQCDPNGNYASYLLIRSDVWTRCGCVADPESSSPFDPETACPDFGLKPEYDTDGTTIIDILCDIPDPESDPTPFSNLNLSIPSRSVPHRFFKESDGSSVDDISGLASSVKAEGTEFSYLDEAGKTEPQNGDFNINSILGQMSVSLTKALPAKMINVELDQTYIITAKSGTYYTPCPTCASDSWYYLYKAFPPALDGVGLQATGHTATRFNNITNTGNGNYEDTIWGRACWVPTTMIPFSHKKYSSAATQRQNRLKTQAAFYVNGYQRDWYGFNKGALIGSFDGVKWFAIGNGRRITSTSTKLFLAINAPFGDLADVSSITANIMVDLGYNTAADYDYNPALDKDDAEQNRGASCQSYHMCEKDLDCITQLGWEYVCADISSYKTNLPKFDTDANEVANDQISSAKFTNNNQIITAWATGGGTKRCVYRGAGAPCKANYESGIINSNTQKLFTCAPNFYCATVDASAFNTELVRTPNQLEDILYGQEANVMGRPLYYVGASETLDTDIQNNIKNNAELISAGNSSNFGLCRPGKSLTEATDLTRHQYADTQNRTDYISQISSCDPAATEDDRVATCPVIDLDDPEDSNYGNYVISPTIAQRQIQNACGKETLTTDSLSPFSEIEAEKISSVAGIIQPTLAQDACMRRAGSPCNTDLDCSPNKLHAEQAELYDLPYFGDTLAEKEYWQQYLVCAQATKEPNIYDDNYYSYDLTLNRCCRAVGEGFSMYTQNYDKVLSDTEYGAENAKLDTSKFPSEGPAEEGRYSRYTVVGTLTSAVNPTPVNPTPHYRQPYVNSGTTPHMYQWKTLHDTARKTCCGGGWVRKFIDGGHDWSIRNRNQFTISSFKCLNYSSPLPFLGEDDYTLGSGYYGIDSNNYDKDFSKLCQYPAEGGCVQNQIPTADGFKIQYPSAIVATGVLDTTWVDSNDAIIQMRSETVPYQPTVYVPSKGAGILWELEENYFGSYDTAIGGDILVHFYLPAYMTEANITKVEVSYYEDDDDDTPTYETATKQTVNCQSGTLPGHTHENYSAALAEKEYCINEISGHKVFHIKGALVDRTNSEKNGGGVRITFNSIGSTSWNYGGGTIPATNVGKSPGNALYYLTKLGRFELLGIPQIFYEPIYCNTDMSLLVDNIFDLSDNTRTEFETAGFDYDTTVFNNKKLAGIYDSEITTEDPMNLTGDIVFQDKVALEKVFAANDFLCCAKLGTTVSAASDCCSNFAAQDTEGNLVCKLTRGTDLMVYFNRFVSGEGTGQDVDETMRLEDADFIAETGEPKLDNDVYDKIVLLGKAHCGSGEVRQGGLFGDYNPEPNSGVFYVTEGYPVEDEDSLYFSITDSTLDSDGDHGFSYFLWGFRWNHHYYCD